MPVRGINKNTATRITLMAVLTMIVVALVALGIAAYHNAGSAEETVQVRCYITIDPVQEVYHYGDTVCLTAHVECSYPDEATQTDLYEDGNWEIIWQQNDSGEEDGWYDVAEGWQYQFELLEEYGDSIYRFKAIRHGNEQNE